MGHVGSVGAGFVVEVEKRRGGTGVVVMETEKGGRGVVSVQLLVGETCWAEKTV